MPSQYNQVPARSQIKIGEMVKVLQKKDYESGTITQGKVKRILTSRPDHPRGIKVMLESGKVGRVQALGSNPVVPVDDNSLILPVEKITDLPGEDDLR